MTGLPFIVSATDLYASNCSSSVGIVSLSMKRNSVRKSPIPSPSHSTAFFASSGFPILHTSSTFVPSADTVGTPANFFKSSFSFLYSSSSPANFCSVSASGFTIASPLVPLSTTLSPFLTAVQIPSILRTAGISIALASIAEWEVLPPTSVSIPSRILRILALISLKSVALCCKSSSGICANISAVCSSTWSSAFSAVIFSLTMSAVICSSMVGS